jgi:hypothetical protein
MKRARYILKMRPHLGPEHVVWDLQNHEQLTISTSMVKRLKRKIHDALQPAPPQLPAPVRRFYERRHPHSLYYGNYLKKTLADGRNQTAFQLILQDDSSRGYVFCDPSLKQDVYTTHHERKIHRGRPAHQLGGAKATSVFFDRDQPQTLVSLLEDKAHSVAWGEPIEHRRIVGLEGHGHGFHETGNILMIDDNAVDVGGDDAHDAMSGPALIQKRSCGPFLPDGGGLAPEPPDLLRPPQRSEQKPNTDGKVYEEYHLVQPHVGSSDSGQWTWRSGGGATSFS